MSFCSVYIPVGVGTYHMETAQDQFERSCAMLRSVDPDIVCPEEKLLTLDALRAFVDGMQPDLVIFQNLTFANAAYMSEVLRRFDCPVLLWTLREPVIDGGRLRLNSLTGAYSAANTLSAFNGRAFNWCFGAPEEESVISAVRATLAAAKVKKAMRSLTMAAIGHTPQGFGFGRALDGELMNTFGVELESIEARELIDMAKSYTEEECAEYLRHTENVTCGLSATPEKNRNDHARLLKAYVSAATGEGTDELIKELSAHMPEGPRYFPEDMVTDQTEQALCAEIIREKALLHLREEVPHGIGVEILRFEQGKNATQIDATMYCEKDSHKRIIIGKGGQTLRQIGQEAREDMEKLFGYHIYLQLWVKVRPGWRDSAEDLKTLGYVMK